MMIRFFVWLFRSLRKKIIVLEGFFFSPPTPTEHHPPTDTTTTGGGVRFECGGSHRAQRGVDGGGGGFRPYLKRSSKATYSSSFRRLIPNCFV